MGIRFSCPEDLSKEFKFTGLFADVVEFLNMVETYYSSELDRWYTVPLFSLTKDQVGEILVVMENIMAESPEIAGPRDKFVFSVVSEWYANASDDDTMGFG